MTSPEIAAAVDPHGFVAPPPPAAAWRRALIYVENTLITFALASMVLLPLSEILLRKFFSTGITGAQGFLQHLSLVVGMLGGCIAARDRRLIAISTLEIYLKGYWLDAIRIVASGFAAAMAAALASGAWEAVQSEDPDKVLGYGIPVQWVQYVIPVGFAVIGLRVLWHGSTKWWARGAALALAIAIVALGHYTQDTSVYLWPALVLLLVAVIAGTPLFAILGGATVILLWARDETLASIAISHYSLVTNPMLPTIPLFTLGGYLLAEGGASKRLVRLFLAFTGSIRGGPAIVTALVCAFFTTFTGASGVTILALGGLLLPILRAARYPERAAVGLVTSAGSLGLLFPPCLPLILYAVIANNVSKGTDKPIDINQMFLAGIIPGILLMITTIVWGAWQAPRNSAARPKFDGREAWNAFWAAKFEIGLPVVTLVALFGGFATPVEAAAVTALYAFIIEVVIHRDLRLFRDVPRVFTECGLLVGGVLLVIGLAYGFATNYLIEARIPELAADWVTTTIHNKIVFLLLLNVFLVIVGCFMDIFSAIIVVVPLIVPLARAFDIDPLHLGVIFLANLEAGFLTPPVGMNLLIASYRFNKSMTEVTLSVLPMLIILHIAVLLITYVPFFTTWLPHLFAH
jgi:C4-dicarboxylate transporter DctM subunit